MFLKAYCQINGMHRQGKLRKKYGQRIMKTAMPKIYTLTGKEMYITMRVSWYKSE